MRVRSIIHALVAVIAVAACSGDTTTDPIVTPPVVTAASVAVTAGNSQTATVGQAATTPLSVTVMGSDAQPFAGATVTWQVTAGGGSISPASSQTNAQGVATAQWTMGNAPGSGAVRASVAGVTAPADFSATALVGAVAAVAVTPPSPTVDALGATVQLTAEARDALGNVIPNAQFTWSSGASAIATVNATGLATGVTVGTASITASAGGVTGSTPLLVRQVLASLTVTPATPSVIQGATLQLAAQGKDSRGNNIAAAPAVTWSSAAQNVATVTAAGVVTGVGAGTSSVTATSGTITSNTAVTVVGNFAPSANTTLSGTMTVGNLTIPTGVTITATGDLNITALGAVQIAGTLTGDCRTITINGRAAATYTGVIRNTCATPPSGARPTMTLNNAGALTITGATITDAGGVSISNSAGAAGAIAGGAGSALRMASPCVLTGGNKRPADLISEGGSFNGTTGTRGSNGHPYVFNCDGDLTIGGGLTIETQMGGPGGGGSVQSTGTGGVGGIGGDITITASGNITYTGLTLVTGNGGNGGTILASSVLSATANGGDGGNGGLVRLNAGANAIIQPGGLTVWIGKGGNGGLGIADAGDGQDASIDPAFPGSPATAVGGNGGNSALVILFAGGTISGRSNIVAEGGDGGQGGLAEVTGGQGGDGNLEFPDGANGGTMNGTGGAGGLARTIDLTGSPNGRSGNGGTLRAWDGRGGWGAARCTPAPARRGGVGGRGGELRGKPGLAGTGTVRGTNGVLELHAVGNGGNGANGEPLGTAGAAGANLTEPGFTRTDAGVSFAPGTAGSGCVQTLTRNVVVDLSTIPSSSGYVATGTHNVTIKDATTGQILGTIPITTVGGNFSHYYGSNPSRIGTDQNGGWRFDVNGLVTPGLSNPKVSSMSIQFVNTTGVTPQNPIQLRQTTSNGTVVQTTPVTSNNVQQNVTMDPTAAFLTMFMGLSPMEADILISFGFVYTGPVREK